MKLTEKQHHIEGLFVLLSFGVFAVCVLLVLLTGAQRYRVQVERGQESWEGRTCLQYAATKVRHGDAAGAVDLALLAGPAEQPPAADGNGDVWWDALLLLEELDGQRYTTMVYCYDGYVRELFTGEGMENFDPESGEAVMAAQALRFAINDEGLLKIQATDSGGDTHTLALCLRSGEVGAS